MAIPTENVGLLPRPAKLQTALRHYDLGKITREKLTREQDAACQDSIQNMEATGSPIVSDGEQRSSSFATYPLTDTLAGTGLADNLAALIVAFPIYLFVVRLILRTLRQNPEGSESPVRKWLTYLAMLIAVGIVIGDLVTFLAYFLRGDLTVRFVLKDVVVLVIAGGVLLYYLGSLRRPVAQGAAPEHA